MNAYEKDTGVKIPNWYLKLPQNVLNRISDIGITLNQFINRKKNIKREKLNDIEFYL